jgi:hypothetical protein
MSTRELCSSGSTDRPGGRKRLQSNAEEVIAKRSKTNDNDSASEDEEPVKKVVTKVKGKKGKNSRYVPYPCEGLIVPTYNLSVG